MAAMVMAILGVIVGGAVESGAGLHPTPEQKVLSGTIVALGDSLTAGYGVKEKEAYPARLEKKLWEGGYHWRVVNAGISGETTAGTLSRLQEVVKLRPAIVILEIGVNDAFQGVDPRVTERNIDEMVRILKGHKVTVLLAGMRMFPFPGSDYGYNEAFASIYPSVAQRHGLILVPFFLAGVAGDPALNKADGIHPTPRGYRIVVETVYPYLLQAIEQSKQE